MKIILLDFPEPLTYSQDMSKTRMPREMREYLAKIGAKGGKKGGAVRASRMTQAQRSESARKAVAARWAKEKAKDGV